MVVIYTIKICLICCIAHNNTKDSTISSVGDKTEDIIDQVQHWILPAASQGNNVAAWNTTIEVARGIAMRGGDISLISNQVLKLTGFSETRVEALQFFNSILTIPSSQAKWLSTEAHATIRPLWQQKTYLIIKMMIINASSEIDVFMIGQRTMTIAYLVSGTPQAILRTDAGFATQTICTCISQLTIEPSLDPNFTEEVVGALLEALHCLLLMSQARQEVIKQLGGTVSKLIRISQCMRSGDCRRKGLECLELLASYPYPTIHPYRKQVTKAAMKACDDKKRAVRMRAISCRNAWTNAN